MQPKDGVEMAKGKSISSIFSIIFSEISKLVTVCEEISQLKRFNGKVLLTFRAFVSKKRAIDVLVVFLPSNKIRYFSRCLCEQCNIMFRDRKDRSGCDYKVK